jgi:alpha-mannosidase
LPLTGSFLTIRPVAGSVVLSACHKAAEDDAILVRVFNPDDTPATIEVSSRDGLSDAQLVDFLERPLRSAKVESGGASIDVGAHRIETIKLSR